MAVLGLRFCARAFSSCGKWGPLFLAVRGPLTIAASLVAEHRLQTRRLSSCGSGLVAPWHVGSSQTRARTRVPCIGRQILNHCATRETPHWILLDQLFSKCSSQLSSISIPWEYKCLVPILHYWTQNSEGELGLSNLWFTKPSRWFQCTPKYEDH